MLLRISIPDGKDEKVLIIQRVDRGNEISGTRGLGPGDTIDIELPFGSQLLVEEGQIRARYSS